MAALLSQCIVVGSFFFNLSSLNKLDTQTTSAVNVARLLYSASAELLETVPYFFDFHAINDYPYFNKYPVTDLLVLGQAANRHHKNQLTVVFLSIHKHPKIWCCLDVPYYPQSCIPVWNFWLLLKLI